MIHVNKDEVAVSGPAPQIMAEISTLIGSITGSLKRDGVTEDEIRKIFRGVVDIGIQAADIPAATIDLSYHKGKEEKA